MSGQGPGVRILGAEETAPGATASQPKAQAGTIRQAQPVENILQRLGHRASLSKEATEYLKLLEIQLNESITTALGQSTEKIKMIPVSCENAAIYRITYANAHILMTFTDTYVSPADQPFAPPAKYLAEAATQLSAHGIFVATTLVVTPESYPMVSKMVQFLTSTFLVLEMPDDFKISLAGLAASSFIVKTDINRVRRAIEDSMPTSVLPPVDIGLAIYTKPKVAGKEPLLMMAIGGTTQFISKSPTGEPVMSGKDFTPLTIITSIVSPSPSLSMAIFGITLAADYFMRRQGWISQFTRFDAEINIGNLIPDTDGKPFRVENYPVLHEFIQQRLEVPGILAIDIADGSPRVAGLELICANAVHNEVANFLNVGVEKINAPISSEVHLQFSGVFKNGEDTRNVTYLSLFAQNPANARAYTPLLVRNSDPTFTLKHLGELFSGNQITPIYTNARTLLNSQFLNMITQMVCPLLKIDWETDTSAINNLGALPVGQINQFGAMPMFGGISPGVSYAMPIYGGGLR